MGHLVINAPQRIASVLAAPPCSMPSGAQAPNLKASCWGVGSSQAAPLPARVAAVGSPRNSLLAAGLPTKCRPGAAAPGSSPPAQHVGSHPAAATDSDALHRLQGWQHRTLEAPSLQPSQSLTTLLAPSHPVLPHSRQARRASPPNQEQTRLHKLLISALCWPPCARHPLILHTLPPPHGYKEIGK